MEKHKITYRQKYLVLASQMLGKARSREGCSYALRHPSTITSSGPKRRYSIDGLNKNADTARRQADTYLRQACGGCALRAACKLADDLPAWENAHPIAGPNKKTEYGQETRKGMLQRLEANTTEDFTEPCDPAQINQAMIPGKQLNLLT